MRLFHLVEPAVWDAAVAVGSYAPPSLETEGFVHFSLAEQVAGTANLRYREHGALVVVEVDPAAVDAELRVEDSYGTGTEFPHIYGPIPTAAAVAVHPIERDGAGDWMFSPAS